MTNWTAKEVQYMEEHASEGAAAIAQHLHRSVRSVESQARRYGISLRKSWRCPKCGRKVFSPLSAKTGWCSVCTKIRRCNEIEEQIRLMREEQAREQSANRYRQKLYSQKSRLKKKCVLVAYRFTSGNAERNTEMPQLKREMGAPNRQVRHAQTTRSRHMVARKQEFEMSEFDKGMFIGFGISCFAFCLVVLFWIGPMLAHIADVLEMMA